MRKKAAKKEKERERERERNRVVVGGRGRRRERSVLKMKAGVGVARTATSARGATTAAAAARTRRQTPSCSSRLSKRLATVCLDRRNGKGKKHPLDACAWSRGPRRLKATLEESGETKSGNTPSGGPDEQKGGVKSKDRQGDVYLVDTTPLGEGMKKHTILIFVSDESGIINRVSSVFSRRGFNIESLAVGLNVDKALFTVVLNSTTDACENLAKQISKLVKVKYVEIVTFQERLERELMLIKVESNSYMEKNEILQTANIFRAKVVDVSDNTVTLCSAGDTGKSFALQKILQKFGVMEVARTGKIALKRGMNTIQDVEKKAKKKKFIKGFSASEIQYTNLEEGIAEDEAAADLEEGISDDDKAGDVYMLDEDISHGIWEVGYMPNEGDYIHNNEDGQEITEGGELVERHTVSMLVQDIPGVLQQVTSVFARRGYNIQSLAVGHAETRGVSRISLVVPGTRSSVENLCKQLLKLVYVVKVQDLTDSPYVSRELMLIKVKCTVKQRRDLIDLSEIFRSKICDISKGSMTIEIEGSLDKMAAFQKMLRPYEIMEVARTGRIALSRESRVDTKFLSERENIYASKEY